MNERAIFEAVLEIPDLADRETYLDEACAGDSGLRSRIEALLHSHTTANDFLTTPAIEQMSPQAPDRNSNPSAGIAELDEMSDNAAESSHSNHAASLKFLSSSDKPGSLGRLGHYEIHEVLGQGAFGIVMRAFDEKLHRMVAIKVMSPELAVTSAPRKRFLREARAAAAIRHENVVAVHAVEEQPVPYLVMEYIPGLTLDQVLNQNGPLDVADVLRLGREIASGLAAAHAQGLIHRDIKPANILLENGLSGRLKITDFGLARAADDASATQSGMIAGTPMFMSPEQATGGTIDQRSDLFSLGSVLYVMVSGRLPFRAASTLAVLKRVVDDTPRPISEIIAESPAWLCDIIAKLQAKSPEERFGSASDVSRLLESCLVDLQANRPVQLQPPLAMTTGQPASPANPHPPEFPNQKLTSSSPTVLYHPNSGFRRWFTAAMLLFLTLACLGVMEATGVTQLASTVLGVTTGSGAVAIETKNSNANVVQVKTEEKGAVATTPAPQGNAGWHGWPAAAPRPAIAPFDAAQAKKHQAEWAAYLQVPVEWENSLGMKFVLIPPGEFLMGSTAKENEEALRFAGQHVHWQACVKSESPRHKVVLSQPSYLGVHEVTQAQYEKVMNANPSSFAKTGSDPQWTQKVAGLDTDSHSVDGVSWNDAAEFCARLSQQEKLKPYYARTGETITSLAGTGYRLPSEAEWEFSCRAGTTTKYWVGDQSNDLVEVCWYGRNSNGRTHSVGELKANPFGLYDMHGNVWEWVQDWWDAAYYAQFEKEPAINPNAPSFANHSLRVVRGGVWGGPPAHCRSSTRHAQAPEYRDMYQGFRVSLTVEAVRQALSNPPTKISSTWPEMSEPPPLEEWLKGREVLTVKQDGTAMFQTIQAALDVQKEGQVVRVLDQGPYRETLNWLRKSDCGLVTSVGTIILQEKWRTLPDGNTIERGHHLGELDNCRLSGFNLISKPLNESQAQTMILYKVPGLCIEDCVVCVADSQVEFSDRHFSLYPVSTPGIDAPVCIRNSVIGLRLEVHTNAGDRFLAVRNWIQNKLNAAVFLVHYNEQSPAYMSVQNNVTLTKGHGSVWWIRGQLNALHVRFQHNTVAGDLDYPLSLTEPAGPAIVIEDNLNLQAKSTSAGFFEKAIPTLPLAREKWIIARNFGISKLLSEENDLPLGDPKTTQPIRMLSEDPLDRNYLRIDPASITRKDKDPFPGALPPGPAPVEGDWFNTLQERWKKVQETYQQLSKTAP